MTLFDHNEVQKSVLPLAQDAVNHCSTRIETQFLPLEANKASVLLLLSMVQGLTKHTYNGDVWHMVLRNAIEDGVRAGIAPEQLDAFIDLLNNIRKSNIRGMMLSEMFPE